MGDDAWRATIDRVIPSCVVIKTTQTRAMDTEEASSFSATGFVVDADRGILLTNRHVTTPGYV